MTRSNFVAIAAAAAALSLSCTVTARSQITFNTSPASASSGFGELLAGAWGTARHEISSKVTGWASEGVRQFSQIEHGDNTYELITHEDFPSYSIRLKEPKLCDDSSASYSGYLDVADDTHIFFWFFESRGDPKKDDLVVWLNGGPGCSSFTGLLFENGPCRIADHGKNTTYNPHSWTESANVIFIDSPVGVGYSYGGKSVNSSPETAEDLYAFIQLFYSKFPKFVKNRFHVSGESYAGRYIPVIGAKINQANKNLPTKNSIHVPLDSLFIGNGLTDIATQFDTIADYSCDDKAKYGRLFDEATCDSIRSKVPTCQRLVGYCHANPSRFTCVPATLSCWQVAGPIQQSGLNPYDVTKKCDRAEDKDGPLCYPEMAWIETYLNQDHVKKELGAASDRTFESCNMQINQAFTFNGDIAHDTASLIPDLLHDGIRVGIYAGELDFLCSWLGNQAWTLALEWSGHDAFNAAKERTVSLNLSSSSSSEDVKGDKKRDKKTDVYTVRSVGKGAGNFMFSRVFDAGHMVPMDQPEASLHLFTNWIRNQPLV